MGYISDSSGLKQNRIKYTKNKIDKLNIIVSQWNFVPRIPQIELECGPRTITHIYYLFDQVKDDVPLKIALENISNYNVDETLYASESRRWAQLFLSNKSYPPYQVQQFQNFPDKEEKQHQKKEQ